MLLFSRIIVSNGRSHPKKDIIGGTLTSCHHVLELCLGAGSAAGLFDVVKINDFCWNAFNLDSQSRLEVFGGDRTEEPAAWLGALTSAGSNRMEKEGRREGIRDRKKPHQH